MKNSDYLAGLEILQKRDPDNLMLGRISRGYSPINCKYLEVELAKLPAPEPKKKRSQKKAKDSVVNKYNLVLQKLFGKRAKQSNRFHICATDQERRAVSINIMNIQEEIERMIREKEYYQEYGELPDKVTHEDYPIPESDMDLIKKRNSLQSHISQLKKELKNLHRKHNSKDRIADINKLLKEKETYLVYVRKAIKEKGI